MARGKLRTVQSEFNSTYQKDGGQPCALRLAPQQSSQCLWPARFMVELVDGHDRGGRSAESSSFGGSVLPVCPFEAELVHKEVA